MIALFVDIKFPFFLPKCGMSQTTLVFPTCFSKVSNFSPKITSFPFTIEQTMHLSQWISPKSFFDVLA
jgi:hypothetical protein